VPPDIRAAAGECFAAGASLFADGLRMLGPHIHPLQRPAVATFLQAVQDLAVWGRSADWVAGRIESRFPMIVTYLKALAPETLIAKAPPDAQP